MTRNNFINTLFDNGEGLTLSQIRQIIDKYIPETIPAGMVEDIAESQNIDYKAAFDLAIEQAYEVFIQRIDDCEDLLEIADVLTEALKREPSDKAVLRLRYSATIER